MPRTPPARRRPTWPILAARLLLVCCLAGFSSGALAAETTAPAQAADGVAQAPPPDEVDAEHVRPSAVVAFRGQPLYEIRAPYRQRDPPARARLAEQRLLALAAHPHGAQRTLHVVEVPGASQMRAGEDVLGAVTDADALRTGRTRQQLAADALGVLRTALAQEFADRSAAALLRAALRATLALVVLVAALVLLLRAVGSLSRRVAHATADWSWSGHSLVGRVLTAPVVAEGLRRGIGMLGWLAAILLAYLWLQYSLALFPWTRGFAARMLEAVSTALHRAGNGIVDYLPSLIQIIVVIVLVRLLLSLTRLVFEQVAAGRVQLRGFYPEWAMPTYSLVRFLAIAIAAVLIFPYLPGAGSEGFKGISVFVGLLISLGSASAIANVVSGLVLTYMRPFQIGDRVKIADTMGDILAKDLFVVRIRTVKNVDITVPNALVLSNHMINFSSSARKEGLILHTTVTIEYDAPWQKVHELLIEAARRTPDIEHEPAPYVLQTALNDHHVTYEINAFTRVPHRMAPIYSDLHANIQSVFHAAGVEILSPGYTSVRDGNKVGIPQDQLPASYRRARFGIELFTREPQAPGGGTRPG